MAETLEEKVARLEAELAATKVKAETTVRCKVTAKGGVSVYGLGRFPVTLYRTQWETLLNGAQLINEFIVANLDKLSEKAEKVDGSDEKGAEPQAAV
jgi:hypothetical protein